MSSTLYYKQIRINVRENRNNPEKLATMSTQDEDKQIKHITQHALDTTMRKQTEIT